MPSSLLCSTRYGQRVELESITRRVKERAVPLKEIPFLNYQNPFSSLRKSLQRPLARRALTNQLQEIVVHHTLESRRLPRLPARDLHVTVAFSLIAAFKRVVIDGRWKSIAVIVKDYLLNDAIPFCLASDCLCSAVLWGM